MPKPLRDPNYSIGSLLSCETKLFVLLNFIVFFLFQKFLFFANELYAQP